MHLAQAIQPKESTCTGEPQLYLLSVLIFFELSITLVSELSYNHKKKETDIVFVVRNLKFGNSQVWQVMYNLSKRPCKLSKAHEYLVEINLPSLTGRNFMLSDASTCSKINNVSHVKLVTVV